MFLKFLKIHRPWGCNFVIKETLAQVFSCKFCEILRKYFYRTPSENFFTEHLREALEKIVFWNSTFCQGSLILMRLIFVATAANVICKPFFWLVLNRSCKTCLGLRCIIMVVCSTAFFVKVSLFSKTFYWNLAKMPFQETFDINYYCCHYFYCTFIHC